ncbi:threonine/serine exporter family protein [Enterococcus asini]|uniref:Threonine/serine exporter family protein n=1 Tax=Enterococcus asini TaxID=57732 RepID=A0AAW8TZI7_9ENTE|nr:threonine/serine exporter family protein [Enterococcus asini]MCD5030192.1 threonine/serine exporter family protein [Enterococcus asini]MDT2785352.1 threonine/serine exporter family protein [Enterococcus asini]MDT2810096.1 threonine/serine exporter family protein [Enterococcus asini]RGW11822.1 threonine/serine exporter [Enterococcus asini]
MTIFIQVAFSFLSTITFGILTNIPKRALISTGITGTIGWMLYWGLREASWGLGFSNFLAAFVIGCLSIYFSRHKKMPMIIFNIPSLVPLVPGGPAYKAVRELVLGDNAMAAENAVIVLVTAGAIAGGFLVTGVVENLIQKVKNHSNATRKKA